MLRKYFRCWNQTYGDLRNTETASEQTCGGKARWGDRVRHPSNGATPVFDALCEKYPEIALNWRAMLMPSVLVGAIFLTCCTGINSPNFYRVTELIPGISTKDAAIATLGPPTATLNAENQTILQWGGPQSPVHLAISFGMDNRMIQVVTDAQKLDQLSGVRP